MPKDPKKNVDRYKIRGGDLNEFEFHQNQADFAEAQTEPTNLIPGTPPEAKALRAQGLVKKAKQRSTKKPAKVAAAKTVGTKKSSKQARKSGASSKKSSKRAGGKKSAKPAKGTTAKKSASKKAAKKK